MLGLHEGATENAVACTALLCNLRDRCLKTDRALLVVLDGGKALHKAVRDVFGRRALIQRCQVHKVRNVLDHLPKKDRARVKAALWGAYRSESEERARRLLNSLAAGLEAKHPSAAGAIREGLDETLTVLRFGLDGALARTLSNTNAIENLNGLVRRRMRNVKRWRTGQMALRWTLAALDNARKGFRRLRGHKQMPELLRAIAEAYAALEGETKVLDHVSPMPEDA